MCIRDRPLQQNIAFYNNGKRTRKQAKEENTAYPVSYTHLDVYKRQPLTTIAISQEYAQKLDEYLKGTGITRKEFVELSVDYFHRTGFDLRGEAFDVSPLEKVAGDRKSVV